jgi:hypothetical protein
LQSDTVRRTDVSVEHRAPYLAAADEVPRWARRSRAQIVLGCVGVVLVAIGVLLATVTARKEWTPPLQLSIVHGKAGQSVATVGWGSTGPVVAQLEVVADGRVLWSSELSRNAAAQNIILPSSLLGPTSHVVVVSKGHTLREVDG